MNETCTRHTSQIEPDKLAAIREFCFAVFDDFSEEDWGHALGGMHVVILEGKEIIAHGSVVQRQLLHRGRALRTGYVESVAVRADRRKQGFGAAVMNELEKIIRAEFDVGALASSKDAVDFYPHRGWILWKGPRSCVTQLGIHPTGDKDVIYVLSGIADIDPSGELTCDWRDGNVW